MVVTLQLRQIDLQPGQCLTLREISWAEFEAILEELGEHRAARVAYIKQNTLRCKLAPHLVICL